MGLGDTGRDCDTKLALACSEVPCFLDSEVLITMAQQVKALSTGPEFI